MICFLYFQIAKQNFFFNFLLKSQKSEPKYVILLLHTVKLERNECSGAVVGRWSLFRCALILWKTGHEIVVTVDERSLFGGGRFLRFDCMYIFPSLTKDIVWEQIRTEFGDLEGICKRNSHILTSTIFMTNQGFRTFPMKNTKQFFCKWWRHKAVVIAVL
jgi:hypothetical protein